MGYVVGGDFQKLCGVGFFDQGLVVPVDDVRGVAGPARGFALVLVVGEMVADGGVPHVIGHPGA